MDTSRSARDGAPRSVFGCPARMVVLLIAIAGPLGAAGVADVAGQRGVAPAGALVFLDRLLLKRFVGWNVLQRANELFAIGAHCHDSHLSQ